MAGNGKVNIDLEMTHIVLKCSDYGYYVVVDKHFRKHLLILLFFPFFSFFNGTYKLENRVNLEMGCRLW